MACSALLASVAPAQPALQDNPLELSTALQRAVQANPRIGSARAGVSARLGAARQAGLWANPSLEAEIEDFGGDRGDIGDGDLTVAVRQTIPLGGDRRRARE
ncbi:MAG: hypothetical protein U9P68_00005, partial [Pseudomonadota bacterium]|nr:hypothetical protein [Pseudomonadota bacterium]